MKVVYQSIDGRIFDTVDEAIERDAFVELKEHLAEAPNYMPDYTKDALAEYLIDLGYIRMINKKTDLEKEKCKQKKSDADSGVYADFGGNHG